MSRHGWKLLAFVIVMVGKSPALGNSGRGGSFLGLCGVGVKRRKSNAGVMKRHRKPNISPNACLYSILPACVSFNKRYAHEST